MHPYIDAHTHAHFAEFENDSDEVIRRALDSNVWVVNVGTQKDTSKKAVEVADKYEKGVYAVVGLHPTHTSRSFHDAKELGDTDGAKGFTSRGEAFDVNYYADLVAHPKVVAIGECGLDYFRLEGSKEEIELIKERQKEAFRLQIALSKSSLKPLMIHCRDAFSDLILELKGVNLNRQNPGIIHFFTGSIDDARELLDLGFSFTFGGVVTFVRDYDQIIDFIPKERILSETDAPYVTPTPFRGKRNEPGYIPYIVKKLAELKRTSEEEMKDQIFLNAQRVFNI